MYTNTVLVLLLENRSLSPLGKARIRVTVINVDFVGHFGIVVGVIVDACDIVVVIAFVDVLAVKNARLVDVVPCGGGVVVILGNGPKAGLALLKGDVRSGGDIAEAAV